jgi:hypothetical protein
MLDRIGSLIGGGLLTGANTLVETIWGSSEKDSRRRARRRADAVAQFAAEFRRLEKRTWWDSFIDGLNRLPRPTLVVLVLGYFALAYVDPVEFQVLNTALEGVPDEAWFLLGAIVTFYFGARELEKSRQKKLTLSRAQFVEQQARLAELRAQAAPPAPSPPAPADEPGPADEPARETPMPDAAYAAAMASARPLSEAVIAEWNRRHRAATGAPSETAPPPS